ncbi:unnamed protein product [Amoebophrya sp. A120]|nr:unnamed protein product [Amoebophrya sp. A120]|eukprot:GSA120T00013534001.1
MKMCEPEDHLRQNDETTQLDLFNRQVYLDEVGLGLAHHLPGSSTSIHGGPAAVTNFIHQHAVLIQSQLPSLADPWTFYRGTDLVDKIEEYVFSEPGDDYLYQNGCRERTVPGGGIRCKNFVIDQDPSDQEFRTHVFTVLNNIWVALQEEARTNEALAFVLLGKKQMQSKSAAAAHNKEDSTAEQGSSSSSSGNKAREDVEDPAAPYQDAVFLPRSGRFLPREEEDLLLADLLAERVFEFVPSKLAFDVDNDTVRIKRASGSGVERDPHREPRMLQMGRRLHRRDNYVISVTSEQSLKYTPPPGDSDLDLSDNPTYVMFYGARPRKQAKPVFRFDLEFAPRIATVDKARPSFDGNNSSSSSSGASSSESSDESFAADGARVDHDRRWQEVEPVDFYREFGIPLPHERRGGFSFRPQENDVAGVEATAAGAITDDDDEHIMLGPILALPNQDHDGEDDNVEITPARDEPEQAQAHRDEPPSFHPPPPPIDAEDTENAKRHYPLAKVLLTICHPLKKQIPGHSLICMDVEVTYGDVGDDQQVLTADGGGSPRSGPTTYKVAVGGEKIIDIC